MPMNKKLKVTGTVVVTFLSLVTLVIYLAQRPVITGPQAGLMVVALLGLYIGFGILIAVYRLISKLD